MKPLMKLISRVFLALALCVSAPAAFADDSSYDIDKERIAQEIREKAMSGDLDGASEAVETYEDSHLAAVKLLIANGVDVNASITEWGFYTPLHYAAYKNEYRAAQLLLENGAKILASDFGDTPLHVAAFNNAAEFAKLLLAYGAEVNEANNDGWTPLHNVASKYSSGYNTLELAKLLIDNGADVNAKGGKYGVTSLHSAVRRDIVTGETEFTQLLIDNGADVNARTGGQTPLYAAIQEKVLLSWYYHPFAVEGADVIGADVIKLLIDNGVDVNARYEKLPEVEEDFCDGCTPLHIAVFIWQTESMEKIMKLLIDNGADVNALITGDAKNGYTPLDVAVEEYLAWASRGVGPEAAKLLIEHGGYCNVVTGYLCGEPAAPPEPKADYTGLYANAAFAVAGAFAPSWVDTQTFAFNEGDKLVTGQSLSVPLDDFTFAASRVQVNDLTDYEFAVKWEMEF